MAPVGSAPQPPPPRGVAFLRDTAAPTITNAGGENSRTTLFAELNKGLDVTKGLKKVTADMQTHKSSDLRVGGVVPAPTTHEQRPNEAPKPQHLASTAIKGKTLPPPRCGLEGGKKWVVEYQKANKQCVVNVENMTQVVYIYKCEDSVVVVKGKVNSITLDSCRNTSVVFDALVSQIEIINCQSVQVQTLGVLPCLTIQKTDGCQVYLSKESRHAEIVTSKSSEMNVLVPDDHNEFLEFPIPEQFTTKFIDMKTGLNTKVHDIV